jgi:hypothetical protein
LLAAIIRPFRFHLGRCRSRLALLNGNGLASATQQSGTYIPCGVF